MTKTFEELKFLILDKQRKTEINKLFHLYVKAQTYGEILQIIKSESNWKWILQNGFQELIPYFPTEELEAQNIFSREVSLTNQKSDIILLTGAVLTLDQSGNRCRLIIDGGTATVNLSDTAMVEVETFQRGSCTINNTGWAYGYVTARNRSQIKFNGSGKSTFYIEAYQDSVIDASLSDDSYIYSKLYDSAILKTNSKNIHGKESDQSKIIAQFSG